MCRDILMYKNEILRIRGHVFGDINIGNGVTIVTTTAAASTTLKNLANQLLKILEEEEKSI